MEDVKKVFDSFREFIWDILTYLLPGVYLILILSVCIRSDYYFSSSLITKDKEESIFYLLVVSYIIGHVITAIGPLKDLRYVKMFIPGLPYRQEIEKNIAQRQDFKACHKIIAEKYQKKNNLTDLPILSVREVKNVIMNYCPGMDQQVYTFSFRSDFCNNISNVSFVISMLGAAFSIVHFLFHCNVPLFKTDKSILVMYILLFVSGLLLRYPRNRFYDLSQRLPFSNYLVRELEKEESALDSIVEKP